MLVHFVYSKKTNKTRLLQIIVRERIVRVERSREKALVYQDFGLWGEVKWIDGIL